MALFVDRATRDANLDALKKSAEDWFKKELDRLEYETAFLRMVLKGRGAVQTGTSNLLEAADKVQSEINSFLGGGL